MEIQIKSGEEVLAEFFEEIKDNKDVDQSVRDKLIELFNLGKLTNTNSSNALLELREKELFDENK